MDFLDSIILENWIIKVLIFARMSLLSDRRGAWSIETGNTAVRSHYLVYIIIIIIISYIVAALFIGTSIRSDSPTNETHRLF